MKTVSRDPATSVPLVFLAFGSTLILASLVGAAYSAAQAWRIEADALVWLAVAVAFLIVAASVTPMMIALGYGNAEIRRLLRFYSTPVRVVHMRHNQPIVFSGSPRDTNDHDDARAA